MKFVNIDGKQISEKNKETRMEREKERKSEHERAKKKWWKKKTDCKAIEKEV